MGIGTSYATFEEKTGYYAGEKDSITEGTMPCKEGLRVYMGSRTRRPKNISMDEWEKIKQEKWDRFFPPKKK